MPGNRRTRFAIFLRQATIRLPEPVGIAPTNTYECPSSDRCEQVPILPLYLITTPLWPSLAILRTSANLFGRLVLRRQCAPHRICREVLNDAACRRRGAAWGGEL